MWHPPQPPPHTHFLLSLQTNVFYFLFAVLNHTSLLPHIVTLAPFVNKSNFCWFTLLPTVDFCFLICAIFCHHFALRGTWSPFVLPFMCFVLWSSMEACGWAWVLSRCGRWWFIEPSGQLPRIPLCAWALFKAAEGPTNTPANNGSAGTQGCSHSKPVSHLHHPTFPTHFSLLNFTYYSQVRSQQRYKSSSITPFSFIKMVNIHIHVVYLALRDIITQ